MNILVEVNINRTTTKLGVTGNFAPIIDIFHEKETGLSYVAIGVPEDGSSGTITNLTMISFDKLGKILNTDWGFMEVEFNTKKTLKFYCRSDSNTIFTFVLGGAEGDLIFQLTSEKKYVPIHELPKKDKKDRLIFRGKNNIEILSVLKSGSAGETLINRLNFKYDELTNDFVLDSEPTFLTNPIELEIASCTCSEILEEINFTKLCIFDYENFNPLVVEVPSTPKTELKILFKLKKSEWNKEHKIFSFSFGKYSILGDTIAHLSQGFNSYNTNASTINRVKIWKIPTKNSTKVLPTIFDIELKSKEKIEQILLVKKYDRGNFKQKILFSRNSFSSNQTSLEFSSGQNTSIVLKDVNKLKMFQNEIKLCFSHGDGQSVTKFSLKQLFQNSKMDDQGIFAKHWKFLLVTALTLGLVGLVGMGMKKREGVGKVVYKKRVTFSTISDGSDEHVEFDENDFGDDGEDGFCLSKITLGD